MKPLGLAIAAISMCAVVRAAPLHAQEAPLNLKMSGYLEAGGAAYQLTGGYPDRRSGFVRGELRSGSDQRWNAELASISEFNDHGNLLVLGYEKQFGARWVAQIGAATSDGAFTLPRLRLDAALGYKWLAQANLVTTLGLTGVQAKDEHRDHALQLSAAYFFDIDDMPWAIEGGQRYNVSNPGSVGANSYYLAFTRGREKQRVISLRLSSGRESYQLVGDNIALVDFPSDSVLLTWREWLARNNGFQIRVDAYRNPFYVRRGVEASWFLDF